VLQVTLEDVYNGKTSKLAVVKNVVCTDCKGIGGKEVRMLTHTCKTLCGWQVLVHLNSFPFFKEFTDHP
jgi:DnaJ family protein A protein 2